MARQVPEGCPLSARQLEVLRLAADSLTYDEIGSVLGISTTTVRSHLHNAGRRLGINSHRVTSAIIHCARRGWFGWQEPPSVDAAPPVGGFLGAYLEAFDEHLRTGSDASRRSMRIALFGAQHANGIVPSKWRPAPEPLERICEAIRGLSEADRRAA